MKTKQQDVTNSYNNLLKQYQKNKDRMSNLGREKDYKVQKISKKYESEIEDCIHIGELLKIQIDNIRQYIEKEKESD